MTPPAGPLALVVVVIAVVEFAVTDIRRDLPGSEAAANRAGCRSAADQTAREGKTRWSPAPGARRHRNGVDHPALTERLVLECMNPPLKNPLRLAHSLPDTPLPPEARSVRRMLCSMSHAAANPSDGERLGLMPCRMKLILEPAVAAKWCLLPSFPDNLSLSTALPESSGSQIGIASLIS